MRIEKSKADVIRVYDANALDAITVIFQDYGPGSGQLIVECYGSSWAAYWGGMGDMRIQEFFLSCTPEYIIGRLSNPHETRRKAREAYLHRIIVAIQEALRSPQEPESGDHPGQP